MKHIILLTLAITATAITYAQQSPIVKVAGYCNLPSACADCGSPKATYGKADSLTQYFSRHISEAQLETISGVVAIQVQVDATGKVCCYSISNRSNAVTEYITSLKIDRIINGMPKWQPAIMNKKPVSSSVPLLLYINTGEQAIRVAYSRTEVQYVKKETPKKPAKGKRKTGKTVVKKTT